MDDLAGRLAACTLELVDIPSESRHEAAVAAHVATLVPEWLSVETAVEDGTLWLGPRRPRTPLVVLAGHYDTVPAQDNLPGRVEDGAVWGLGASDMKGGVAVALELLRALDPGAAVHDLGLLLFGKEELPPAESPLPALFESSEAVHEADLVVLLEPTDATLQAGCVGNLTARLVFQGRSGHAARPWLADNAIERALDGLRGLVPFERREAVVGGLPFYEVLTVTQLHAGIADNVVPDRAVAHVNLRYPPDRSATEAEALLRGLVPQGAELVVDGNSPPARVVLDAPLVRALRAAGDLAVEPKQAWTNAADFTERGIDAVNLGPGGTRWAHARDERVEIESLVAVHETLRAFLAGAGREAGAAAERTAA